MYFGKDDDLDENDSFVKNYLMNKGWIERESKGFDYGDVVGVSEDENELEEQDRWIVVLGSRRVLGIRCWVIRGLPRVL